MLLRNSYTSTKHSSLYNNDLQLCTSYTFFHVALNAAHRGFPRLMRTHKVSHRRGLFHCFILTFSRVCGGLLWYDLGARLTFESSVSFNVAMCRVIGPRINVFQVTTLNSLVTWLPFYSLVNYSIFVPNRRFRYCTPFGILKNQVKVFPRGPRVQSCVL